MLENKNHFFLWLHQILTEYQRVLKPGGSLYLFAGPHLATDVEMVVREHFTVLNQIIWRKPTGRHCGCKKQALRKYFPQTEHIIFAESKKKLPFSFDSIRLHLSDAKKKSGVSRNQINEACDTKMAGHWLDKSQWSLPSEKHYNTLNALFENRLKPYADIQQQYHLIKQKRRHFSVTKHVPFTNVWDFKPVSHYAGKHPCEKPLNLMRHIIQASSNPSDVVLDTFAGSGSTAIACMNLQRQFVGCEMGDDEFNQAINRIQKHA